ncbi:chorismate mutase [Aneurinibacillus terranovensis]|uniref:chorismate mutase n=1 Tax=Aneurinibacillus terranovensis TaxID=278991 RepID=UPI000420B1DB|nr:chorismate mutase [Aneurinibacillus terranovensis]
MAVRGVRGAITVPANEEKEILSGTETLVRKMIEVNEIEAEDVASVVITVTQDLNAAFPARAVRCISGWDLVPLMCSTEISVPGGLERCIRVMMLINTEKTIGEIHHVFLEGAVVLRPDLHARENNLKESKC